MSDETRVMVALAFIRRVLPAVDPSTRRRYRRDHSCAA